MFSLRSALLSLLIIGIFSSCADENIDSMSELELPEEPVVIDVEEETNPEVYLQTTLNSDLDVIEGGDARVVEYDDGTRTYMISSGLIECIEENGFYTLQSNFGSSPYPNFFFDFFEGTEENYLFSLFYTGEINGELTSTVLFPQIYECGDYMYPEVTITDLTEDHVEGFLEGDLFTFNPDVPLPDPNNCDAWLSLGVMTIAFSLPYSSCE